MTDDNGVDRIGSTSFTFTEQDVLYVSLSLNALYFLQLVVSRCVNWLLPVLSPRWSRGRTLHGIHQRWPNLLGRLLMEQTSLLVLLILALINLWFVSSMVPPFSYHPEDNVNDNDHHHDGINDKIHYNRVSGYDNTNNNNDNSFDNNDNNNNNDYGDNSPYHQLTRVILSYSAARFLLIAIGIVQHGDTTPIRITSTDTRNSPLDLLYCLFSFTSNIIGMGFKQNLRLLVTSSFMELDTTSLVICRLIKLADRHRCCKSYLKTSMLCCAYLLFSRILLPVLFLCHALSQESPFVMDNLPLIWFFISGVFYSVFHAIFIFYSVRRIVKASTFLSEGASHTCAIHEPFLVSERLINELYNNCDESPDFDVIEQDSSFDRDEMEEFKSKPSTKLRDLNYGFLAPYDNRNLCSFVTGVEEEKINFLQKKNISKNELVYKFLIKGGGDDSGDVSDDNKMPSRTRFCQQCNIEHESNSNTSSGNGHVEYCKALFEMRECDETDDPSS